MSAGPALDLKNIKYELYEPELQALNAEVIHHPQLQDILSKQADKDFYIQLADISLYCGVVLDGDYTKDDILKLCTVLTKKLYEARTQIILPLN
jgi:hypothetical protein